MRSIQHKKEAYWFYRFLSIFYDGYVNPLFWTPQMRTQALELAQLISDDLLVLEAGSGTGFTTLGIIQRIRSGNIFCLDQSPHQMAKARKKAELLGCSFQIGDSENLPYSDNHFDRYISAGSIEYWPNPQRGISEAFRVLKPGGIALIIGPLHPQNWFAGVLADAWMLFPEENEYVDWFRNAGFEKVATKYIKPDWVQSEKYGIAIAGSKPNKSRRVTKPISTQSGENEEGLSVRGSLRLIGRLIVGSIAGFLFIPIALMGHLRKFLNRPLRGRKE